MVVRDPIYVLCEYENNDEYAFLIESVEDGEFTIYIPDIRNSIILDGKTKGEIIKEIKSTSVIVKTVKIKDMYKIGLTWSKLPEGMKEKTPLFRRIIQVFSSRDTTLYDVACALEVIPYSSMCKLFDKKEAICRKIDELVIRSIRGSYRL